MRKLQKVSIVAGTFLLAAATGHVMQSVSPDLSEDMAGPAGGVLTTTVAPPKAAMRVQLTSLTVLHNPPAQTIAPDLGVGTIPRMPEATEAGFSQPAQTGCDGAALDLGLVPPGAISVSLTAGCARNSTLKVQDSSLQISAQTDAEGNWQGIVPAMQEQNSIVVHGATGPLASGSITAPEVGTLNRVVLSTKNTSGLHLNIYERSAGFGDSGHISVATPRTPDTPLGGYMMQYQGPDDTDIEVYTAPASLSPIRLQIEAEVTPGNCGKTVTGAVRRILANSSKPAEPIRIDMPSCEALGQLVIFPLPDLQNADRGRMVQK